MHDDAIEEKFVIGMKKIGFICLGYVAAFFFVIIFKAQAQIPTPEKELQYLAKKSFQEKKFSESLVHFSKLIRINRKSIIHVFNYGVTCLELGRNDEAMEYFVQVVESKSNLKYLAMLYAAEVLRRKGEKAKSKRILLVLSKQEKIPEKLKEEIFRELTLVSEESHAQVEFGDLLNQGIKKFQEEKFMEAHSYWGAAYQRDRSWELEMLLSIASWKLDRKEESRGYWRRVIDASDDRELEKLAKELLKL